MRFSKVPRRITFHGVLMTFPLTTSLRHRARSFAVRRALRLVLAASLGAAAMPTAGVSQEKEAPAGPVLASFASMRVALLPVQLWRADTTGWSGAVEWASMRLALDSAFTAQLQERGLGNRWAYASDVVRSAKRNPTYASDPYSIGVSRWRTIAPKPTDPVPPAVSDNLRPLTALGDTRHALIPVELRAAGEFAVLRLVLVDARLRRVVWIGEIAAPSGAGMLDALAQRLADLVISP